MMSLEELRAAYESMTSSECGSRSSLAKLLDIWLLLMGSGSSNFSRIILLFFNAIA